jgi:glutamate decarboxylase
MMVMENKTADATLASLYRIFTVPEAPDSTLSQIEQEISQNLNQFLNTHIATQEKPLSEIEKDFNTATIPEHPEFVSDHTQFLLNKLVAHSVHTSSPSFIGHMTSALPYFLMPLSKIMIGLNQNLVKIETSKAFTPLERQVLGMLHNLIYNQSESFYQKWMHSAAHSLGAMCSGGTIANITALWVARNNALKADGNFKGLAQEGLFRAMKHYGYDDLAIFVSDRGHYSLKKSADVLGIGQHNLIAIPTDKNNRICVSKLREALIQAKNNRICPIAIVGVAGTTETGNVDPLNALADIAEEFDCHFHVDAAWGGATLMSNRYRHLLSGIERADSVTIDAHKQLYIPMGAGMVLFKSPTAMRSIEHHAEYILRKGSKDLGSHTLEGSRSGMAMLLFSGLHIISRRGYELLINNGIENAQRFATMIESASDFELISAPELCLLTYRYVPKRTQQALQLAEPDVRHELLDQLDALTIYLQKTQRESGKSFVSRTRITAEKWQRPNTTVFRVVLANPLTTEDILQNILIEQKTLAENAMDRFNSIEQLTEQVLNQYNDTTALI